MQKCTDCLSERIMWVSAKCNDMCQLKIGDKEKDGYVPDGIGIGGGDYIEFEYCLECGKIQYAFPVIENHVFKDEDNEEF